MRSEPGQANLLADEAAELLGARPPVFTDLAQMVREIDGLEAADVTATAARTTRSPSRASSWACTCCAKSRSRSPSAAATADRRGAAAGRVLSVAENYRRDPIKRLGPRAARRRRHRRRRA